MSLLKYYRNKLSEYLLFKRVASKKHKLYNQNQALESPIFIISAGRSGTTLLRKMLMRGGEIHFPPESDSNITDSLRYYIKHLHKPWEHRFRGVLEIFSNSKSFKYWETNLWSDENQLLEAPDSKQTFYTIIEYIYHLHSQKSGNKPLKWGDKSPYLVLELKWLKMAFPNARFIHLIRDGRDVVSSRIQAFNEPPEVASKRWLWSVIEVEKVLNKNSRLLEIRYENLVTSSAQTLTKVCEFAELKFKYKMLENQDIDLGDDVLEHHASTKKEITTKSIGKWKESLSKQHQQIVKPLLEKTLARKGYTWD